MKAVNGVYIPNMCSGVRWGGGGGNIERELLHLDPATASSLLANPHSDTLNSKTQQTAFQMVDQDMVASFPGHSPPPPPPPPPPRKRLFRGGGGGGEWPGNEAKDMDALLPAFSYACLQPCTSILARCLARVMCTTFFHLVHNFRYL